MSRHPVTRTPSPDPAAQVGRLRATPEGVTVRATRSHTVARDLEGLDIERMPLYQAKDLKELPAQEQRVCYTLHDTSHRSGVVVAVLTAYGPDPAGLLNRLKTHLEKPSVGYSVETFDGLAEHEAMVRRANADELRSRRAQEKAAAAATAAPPRVEGPDTGLEGLF
ncbi:hypothetical protein SMD44_p10032 (plasmid) [Streptomyces alboflavus]|uniref:Uncharacterized protein n=1 Tax=Streptomyces alboflavus TaxID=67267 RepID=A0A291W4G3_9ACTN|nr:hypothetical protein [Streptomyces alboflavus]ATM24531.1 hypothetical protein SMD44_p10032 [Streptomyces alboflavus]